jgi:hypothetical protein
MTRSFAFLNLLRLALFSVAYGVMGALVGGTLNRLLVAELGLPVTVVGLFFAVPLLTSPIRVWLGYHSDTHPLWGKRREPYLFLGAILAALGILSVAYATAYSLTIGSALLFALFLAFVLYGFGRNLAHNTFQALLAERLAGEGKRYITYFEVATLVGSVIGAGAIGNRTAGDRADGHGRFQAGRSGDDGEGEPSAPERLWQKRARDCAGRPAGPSLLCAGALHLHRHPGAGCAAGALRGAGAQHERG